MREKLSSETNGDERDTYAWIEAHYPLSSSQEDLLSSAPHLLPNSDLISSEDAEAEDDPVVVMLSVPMTSSEHDEYTTPPERHSTEDKFEDQENIVDLSRDSDVFGGVECKLNVLASVCADEVNGLKCNGKGTAAPATDPEFVCGSGNASRGSKCSTFPYSFDSRIETDQRDRVGSCQGGKRAGTCGGSNLAGSGAGKGVDKKGISDADNSSGKKYSERNEEEEGPTEKELTENILKVLSLLAKPLKPMYKEKVDIIGSAIKAGITFPRPSWWPEDSDDDSD